MSKWLILLFTTVGLVSFRHFQKRDIVYPDYWPTPKYDFSKNPSTEEGFQLGRKLFYDTRLSRDNTISCASCHLMYTGFTHVDHKLSHGIEGRKGTRNSLALINLAWNEAFHWDGGVNHLNAQPINPIQHEAEMDFSLDSVLIYLQSSPIYKKRFFDAFGDSIATTNNLLKAFAQFTTQLISSNSKYDQVMVGSAKFTEQELKGKKLFENNCNACHKAPLFITNEFKSNGLPIDSSLMDLGRYEITKKPEDSLHFKVPTLRNIQHTFPYMHDGRFSTLSEVLDFYTSNNESKNNYLSPELRKRIQLSPEDKKDLIAFLYTLTDYSFLRNKNFSYPNFE